MVFHFNIKTVVLISVLVCGSVIITIYLNLQCGGQQANIHKLNKYSEQKQYKGKANGINCLIDGKNEILRKHNFQTLVDEKRNSKDPDVISLMRELIDPPSDHMLKRSYSLLFTPQAKEAFSVLNQKKGGFFIECGALDGERSSNTISLEVEHNWRGILMEMDPYFYTQLVAKNRKAWSINGCMSPTPYVSYLNYSEDSSGLGQLLTNGLKGSSSVHRQVPCFPVESLIIAINKTKIDFFSLDVEGMELEILKTIPFDQIDITVLTVEYAHVVGGVAQLKSFMESKGYVIYKQIDVDLPEKTLFAHDIIFVKKSYLGNSVI